MAMIKEILKSLIKKPETILYPSEKKPPVENIRAKIHWDIEKCIGCGLCPKICPSKAIKLTGKGSNAEITYNLDRCLFCGECVEICPTEAIISTSEYELAFTQREEAKIHHKRLKSAQTKIDKKRVNGE